MERDQLSRKLAVILHADVVGSTSLVQKNEALAHKRIQAAFQKFSETIKSYGGIAREIRGDALVAEFNRASDAVAAALAYQILNSELNAAIDDDIQPKVRIGISLGEVIIADNTITGTGVVLAQRLEQLADPGGVVVQGSVSETVPTRLPFDFESMGEQVLKGFDQPVRAFSVSLILGEDLPMPELKASSSTVEPYESQASSKLSREFYETLTGERLDLPDKPSIAVLPFQNISADPEQEYFADGITEDIITALSRVPDLIVIARNSTFVYKGQAVDVRQVGQELGVRHVLEGSIRKNGDRLRITAQLVDTISGDHIWAERYDRKLDDIFDIQDEIAHSIVVQLHLKLVTGEYTSLWSTGTSSIEAWELVIRSRPLVESHVRDDAQAGKHLLERALELDKNYSAAWVFLGWIYWEESIWKWCSDPEKSMQLAFEAAQKALSADVRFPDGYSLLGNIFMVRGDSIRAIAMCEKAVELAPGDSGQAAFLSNVLIDSDRVKEGIQKMQRAIRLCPFPPSWYLLVLGIGFHLDADNEAAISTLEQAVKREPDSHIPRLWVASTLVEMGRLDEARAITEEIKAIEPTFSAVSWAQSFKSKSHARLKDNLLTAGFSE
jgi:adenylate cyclase